MYSRKCGSFRIDRLSTKGAGHVTKHIEPLVETTAAEHVTTSQLAESSKPVQPVHTYRTCLCTVPKGNCISLVAFLWISYVIDLSNEFIQECNKQYCDQTGKKQYCD